MVYIRDVAWLKFLRICKNKNSLSLNNTILTGCLVPFHCFHAKDYIRFKIHQDSCCQESFKK